MNRPTAPSLHARRLRSITGLVIGVYATLHLANHMLGLVSIEAQETARPWFMALWQTWPGQLLLYGSLVAHAGLSLMTLAQRREWKMPAWEAMQILFGVAIPYLLLVHIGNTRLTHVLTGRAITYEYELAALWMNGWVRFRQILLVGLVWGHFAMGLHFWLRLRPRYRRWFPLILVGYVLVPLVSLLGFAEAGLHLAEQLQADPARLAAIKAQGVPLTAAGTALRAAWREQAGLWWLGLVGLVAVGAQVRNTLSRGRRFTVRYPDGAAITASIGMSVLEVSRMSNHPHQAACGGRGRCTTCRVRVQEAGGPLPEPGEIEAEALGRIHAPEHLRLACQLRPEVSLSVYPLVPGNLPAHRQKQAQGPELGEEREVTILFVDVRGSTQLAERRMPYDVVFLLSHFFAEMSAAVEGAGGHYSNFTGDGLMAIFGLPPASGPGAKAALYCAWDMLERLKRLNEHLADELDAPLAIGLGIHTGLAIVGRMGPPKTPVITALGDTVNTAARLEAFTKEAHQPVVVSMETLRIAGVNAQVLQQEVLLRGRSTMLPVAALDMDALAFCLLSRDPDEVSAAP